MSTQKNEKTLQAAVKNYVGDAMSLLSRAAISAGSYLSTIAGKTGATQLTNFLLGACLGWETTAEETHLQKDPWLRSEVEKLAQNYIVPARGNSSPEELAQMMQAEVERFIQTEATARKELERTQEEEFNLMMADLEAKVSSEREKKIRREIAYMYLNYEALLQNPNSPVLKRHVMEANEWGKKKYTELSQLYALIDSKLNEATPQRLLEKEVLDVIPNSQALKEAISAMIMRQAKKAEDEKLKAQQRDARHRAIMAAMAANAKEQQRKNERNEVLAHEIHSIYMAYQKNPEKMDKVIAYGRKTGDSGAPFEELEPLYQLLEKNVNEETRLTLKQILQAVSLPQSVEDSVQERVSETVQNQMKKREEHDKMLAVIDERNLQMLVHHAESEFERIAAQNGKDRDWIYDNVVDFAVAAFPEFDLTQSRKLQSLEAIKRQITENLTQSIGKVVLEEKQKIMQAMVDVLDPINRELGLPSVTLQTDESLKKCVEAIQAKIAENIENALKSWNASSKESADREQLNRLLEQLDNVKYPILDLNQSILSEIVAIADQGYQRAQEQLNLYPEDLSSVAADEGILEGSPRLVQAGSPSYAAQASQNEFGGVSIGQVQQPTTISPSATSEGTVAPSVVSQDAQTPQGDPSSSEETLRNSLREEVNYYLRLTNKMLNSIQKKEKSTPEFEQWIQSLSSDTQVQLQQNLSTNQIKLDEILKGLGRGKPSDLKKEFEAFIAKDNNIIAQIRDARNNPQTQKKEVGDVSIGQGEQPPEKPSVKPPSPPPAPPPSPTTPSEKRPDGTPALTSAPQEVSLVRDDVMKANIIEAMEAAIKACWKSFLGEGKKEKLEDLIKIRLTFEREPSVMVLKRFLKRASESRKTKWGIWEKKYGETGSVEAFYKALNPASQENVIKLLAKPDMPESKNVASNFKQVLGQLKDDATISSRPKIKGPGGS